MRHPSAWPTRRRLLAGGAALTLAGCGRRKDAAPAPAAQAAGAPAAPTGPSKTSIAWAVAGDWRGQDAQRDAVRHPAETLAFFGLQPGMTVVELWPGAGWYTKILAPFLKQTGGKLYAASFETTEGAPSAAASVVAAYRAMVADKPDLYGDVEFGSFGPHSPPLAPPGTADLVLFMLNLHSWMAAGLAEKAFQDAYTALKPDGVLGVEAHREESGRPQDPLAANGYVQEAYVKQLAQEAGFRFDKASEINANPQDDRKRPVDAVAASDRMTLRFIKPA